MADLGDRPVLVVRESCDEDGDAARAVALVDDLLEVAALELAGAFLDGPLDVVGRHVDGLGVVDGLAQAGVGVGVAAAARAAMVISRMILVKILPRLASVAAFLCLIEAHFECPDMVVSLSLRALE